MKLLKNGDLQAFDEIYDQTNRIVYYVIYQIVKEQSLAEDVMQDVYMRLVDKIDLYNPQTTPKAWIVQMARNLAINEYNKRSKEMVVEDEEIDLIASSSTSKETPLIDLARANLPEDEFLILMLCVGEDKTRKEVAEVIGLSISGVSWKLDQAMKKMKKLVKEGK
jgi:RNA polymerase sigma-70 factor (ECF subfamily)